MNKKQKELKEAANDVIHNWEALPGGRDYSPKVIADWLKNEMKPAIDKLRKALQKEIPA
jgi:hypothetical protein